MKSIDSCDNNACVQCQRTKYVDFLLPKKKVRQSDLLLAMEDQL